MSISTMFCVQLAQPCRYLFQLLINQNDLNINCICLNYSFDVLKTANPNVFGSSKTFTIARIKTNKRRKYLDIYWLLHFNGTIFILEMLSIVAPWGQLLFYRNGQQNGFTCAHERYIYGLYSFYYVQYLICLICQKKYSLNISKYRSF